MNFTPHPFPTISLVNLLIIAVCIYPLLGIHIHLAEPSHSHGGHAHAAEAHSIHDNIHTGKIDVSSAHNPDSAQIDLEGEATLTALKILKIFVAILLSFFSYTLLSRLKLKPALKKALRFTPPIIIRIATRAPPSL